jgi:hypothetical protein
MTHSRDLLYNLRHPSFSHSPHPPLAPGPCCLHLPLILISSQSYSTPRSRGDKGRGVSRISVQFVSCKLLWGRKGAEWREKERYERCRRGCIARRGSLAIHQDLGVSITSLGTVGSRSRVKPEYVSGANICLNSEIYQERQFHSEKLTLTVKVVILWRLIWLHQVNHFTFSYICLGLISFPH